MDQMQLHQHNTSRTLRLLYGASPLTMAELKTESGLSRRTLELILENLTAKGWVTENDAPPKGARSAGRPARSFSFNYQRGCLLVIQLEAGRISATIADLAATPMSETRRSLPVRTSRQERLLILEECVDKLLVRSGRNRKSVMSVTVSTPGIVHDEGTIHLPATMPEWTGFSLSEAVGRLFGCPVRVENDAKLAALGEKWSREGEAQDFAYIFSDSERFGVGLVIRNELYRGLNGAAGEIASAPELGLSGVTSPLLVGLEDADSPHHERSLSLVSAARSGEPQALEEVESLAHTLVPAVTALAWILAPQEIVLGGGLGAIQDLLVPALQKALESNDRPIATRIRGSQFGDESILNGCLRMGVESLGTELFDSPDLHPSVPDARDASRQGV